MLKIVYWMIDYEFECLKLGYKWSIVVRNYSNVNKDWVLNLLINNIKYSNYYWWFFLSKIIWFIVFRNNI